MFFRCWRLLPTGILGLVFAALIAAIIASTASKINSIATIFTLDLYNKFRPTPDERKLVLVGRIAAVVSILIAIVAARPLLGSFDQAFQYIQEYTGFFTPGIVVIFMLGLFWKPATEEGALAATIGSFAGSLLIKWQWDEIPFMNRMVIVFVLALVLAVVVSLMRPARGREVNHVITGDVSYRTSWVFNLASVAVILILAALYLTWW